MKGRPKTLSADFVDDLLEVTGGGRARDFATARDHAIIRILRTEGIRRSELPGMVMSTLPAGVIKNPTFRLVPLAPATARALATYLRARPSHPKAGSDAAWLGIRGTGRLGTGLRDMLLRRAEQAGYYGGNPTSIQAHI